MFNKNKKIALLLLPAILLLSCTLVCAQNLNTPNKIGPMGTQVNTYSGNLFIAREELSVPARGFDLDASFFYNSFNYDINAGFGNGWDCSFCIRYSSDTGGKKIITWGDGREDVYTTANGGGFNSPKGTYNILTQPQANQYLVTEPDGTKIYFNNSAHRKITRMDDPNGNFLNFNYSDSMLTSVVNNAGQTLSFNYDASGRLIKTTDALVSPVRTYQYSYDAQNNLVQSADPLNGTCKYNYFINGPMKSMEDKNHNLVDIIYYPDFTVSELIGCNKRISFSYDTTLNKSIVTDYFTNADNRVTAYQYRIVDDRALLTKKSSNCCNDSLTFLYDDAGNLLKQTDPNNHSTIFTYNDKGNVLTVTNALGQTSSLSYTESYDKVASATDAKGNTRTLEYDSRGNLTRFTQPGGLVTNVAYNSTGDITSMTDPKGNVLHFTYDSYGNATGVSGPLGFALSFTNDARGRILSFTDARSFVYQCQYDLLDRLLSVTDPAGHSITRSYDAEGNLISLQDENGLKDLMFYDASNRLSKIKNAKGYQTAMAYDAMDNLISLTDALGNKGTFVYDNLNRMISSKDALGNTTAFSYDLSGNMLSSASPAGRVITYSYDALNRLVKSQDEQGVIQAMSYDANGNIISSTDGTGAVTAFQYDVLNRPVKVTDALGNESATTYDSNGNILTISDRNNKTIQYVYDALNNLTSYTDKNGNKTDYTFDAAGNITSVKDAKNNTTLYAWDNLNRFMKLTYPDGKYMQLTYDNTLDVVSKRMPDGSTVSLAYDSLNRLVSRTLPNGNISTYAYDALNRMMSAANNHGIVAYTYDAIGRKTSESFDNKTTRYAYDMAARLETIIYPDSTVVNKLFTKRGEIASVSKNNLPVISFQYNSADRVTAATFANGLATGIQYDFANRLSTMNTGNINNASYAFDKQRNKITVAKNNPPSSASAFTYDNGSRLTAFSKGASGPSPAMQHTYGYDAIGKRTAVNLNGAVTSFSSNNLNQITNASGSQNVSYVYDDNGNLTYDGRSYKSYDAEGKILSDSASPANSAHYYYDALGRRIEKKLNSLIIKYSYDGISQIQQREGNTDTLLNTYVFGAFTSPIMFERNNKSYYCIPNESGSIEVITDSTGAAVERYAYDPYGAQTVYDGAGNILPASALGNRFGFSGQEYDQESGNNHFFYRQYSPQAGTFNQRDPSGYYEGPDPYQYAGNNPENNTDELGLKQVGDGVYEPTNVAAPTGTEIYNFLRARADNAKNLLSAAGVVDDFIIKNDKQQFLKLTLNQLKNVANAERFKKLLDSRAMIRLAAGLKFIFLAEKVYKTIKTWNKTCPLDKTIAVTEISISGYSLIFTLNKGGWIGKSVWKQLPWLKAYGILDAISKLTTGNSILTNTKVGGNAHLDFLNTHPKMEAFEEGFFFPVTLPAYLMGAYDVEGKLSEGAKTLTEDYQGMHTHDIPPVMP